MRALYDWFGLNTRLFEAINGYHTPALDGLVLTASTLGHPNLFPFYIAAALWISWRMPTTLALRNVLTFALGYLLTSIVLVPVLKRAFDFPRPITALGASHVVLVGDPDRIHSFPSGHAAFAALFAASLMPGAPRSARLALATFAVLVCISRVSSGAHFPADVMTGALLALGVVALLRATLPGDIKR